VRSSDALGQVRERAAERRGAASVRALFDADASRLVREDQVEAAMHVGSPFRELLVCDVVASYG
jgi:hypothetical protein